jgi:transposase
MLVNGLRAHMAEFGIIAPQGIRRVPELVAMLKDQTTGIPQIAREALTAVVVQIENLSASIRLMPFAASAAMLAKRQNVRTNSDS